MAKTVEPLPTVLIGYALYALVIFYLYKVFTLSLIDEKPVEKAAFFFLEDTKILEKEEPAEPIAEDLSCSIRDQPAYGFDGIEFKDVRNVKCNDCQNYVYKDGETCSPYKYNSDEGYCEVNKSVSGLCPF